MNTNNITELIKEKTVLQEEAKELTKKYIQLETEEKNMETVIQCQARKNEIQKQKEEITFRIYEITGELLEENEETRKIKNEIKI